MKSQYIITSSISSLIRNNNNKKKKKKKPVHQQHRIFYRRHLNCSTWTNSLFVNIICLTFCIFLKSTIIRQQRCCFVVNGFVHKQKQKQLSNNIAQKARTSSLFLFSDNLHHRTTTTTTTNPMITGFGSQKTNNNKRRRMTSTTTQALNTITTRSSSSSSSKASTTSTTQSSSSSSLLMKMISTTDTTDNNINDDNDVTNDDDDLIQLQLKLQLLEEYKNHKSVKYHYFTKIEAIEIRCALLKWYRMNRRKLPWRGDPPPYTGSTAGINNNKNTKNKKGTTTVSSASSSSSLGENKNKNKTKAQSNITSFFNTTNSSSTRSTRSKQRTTKQEDESKDQQGGLDDDNNNSNNNDCCDDDEQQQQQQQKKKAAKGAIPITGYGIWVSEIMLQQTRVEAVIPYWIKWMETFPTIEDLANASDEQVNSNWAGLGFYRRAKLLHMGAKYVVSNCDGKLPQTTSELLKLPGVGPYTANAIASIAFNKCVPVVDGNVCRVLSRLKGISNHIKSPILKDKFGWVLAKQLVEATTTNGNDDGNDDDDEKNEINNDNDHNHFAGEVNQALMELGATYCSPSGTGIDHRDPLKDYYMSTKLGRAYHQQQQIMTLENKKKKKQKQGASLLTTNRSSSSSRNNNYDEGDDGNSNSSTCCCCELCQSGEGIEFVLQTFQEQIITTKTNNITNDEAAIIGHTTFPLDPPKGKKREEDIVVAAISNTVVKMGGDDDDDDDDDGNTWWLLVKRPPNGLLAGQWEFPSVCVGVRGGDDNNDKKKKKTKISSSGKNKKTNPSSPAPPGIQKRRKAMDTYLKELFDEDLDNMIPAITTSSSGTNNKNNNRINIGPAPLEHIFSHIKHYMWIETCETAVDLKVMEWTATTSTSSSIATTARGRGGKNNKKNSNDTTKKEVRWMREKDMKEVGITSGVQKILKAVKQQKQQQKKERATNKSPFFSKKRKR